jgi:translation initiation factor RLI1
MRQQHLCQRCVCLDMKRAQHLLTRSIHLFVTNPCVYGVFANPAIAKVLIKHNLEPKLPPEFLRRQGTISVSEISRKTKSHTASISALRSGIWIQSEIFTIY